jgi:hypothetical protein
MKDDNLEKSMVSYRSTDDYGWLCDDTWLIAVVEDGR